MKKLLFFVALLMSFATISAQEIINYFEVASNITKPVTLNTNDGEITIWGGERITGNIWIYSAYDGNGNQIVNTTPYKTEIGTNKPTIRRYRFQTLYNSSSSESSNSSSSSSSNDNMRKSIEQTTESVKRAQNQYIDYAASQAGIEMSGYPNFQVRTGASLVYGEFVALQAELGGKGGWILGGGVGKDLIRGDERLVWYADMGMYSGDENNLFVMGVVFGKNIAGAPMWASSIIHDEEGGSILLGTGMYIGWEHYFEDVPRLGFFTIAQLNLGSAELRAGISWKLFAKLPYFNFE